MLVAPLMVRLTCKFLTNNTIGTINKSNITNTWGRGGGLSFLSMYYGRFSGTNLLRKKLQRTSEIRTFWFRRFQIWFGCETVLISDVQLVDLASVRFGPKSWMSAILTIRNPNTNSFGFPNRRFCFRTSTVLSRKNLCVKNGRNSNDNTAPC